MPRLASIGVAVALLLAGSAAAAHLDHERPAHEQPARQQPAHQQPAAKTASAEPDVPVEAKPLPLDIGGPFALTDHQGNAVTDRSFHGRFLLLFFGYANCPGICPIGLHGMTEALDLLGAEGAEGDAVVPVLITVDPERDTPATLAPALAEIHPRLIGLTGTPEQLAAVRRAYRIGAEVTGRDLAGGSLYRHGTFIYLIGPNGQFLSLFPPVIDPAALAAAVARYLG